MAEEKTSTTNRKEHEQEVRAWMKNKLIVIGAGSNIKRLEKKITEKLIADIVEREREGDA